MTHCRMCSQRLPRPGKLCRECERELQRARAAAASVDNLSSAVPLIDAARMASAESIGWVQRLRSGPTVLVTAFSVGIASAAALYVVQGTHAAGKSGSVMLDRDLIAVEARDRRAANAPAQTAIAPNAATVAPARKAAPAPERREPVVVKVVSTGARAATDATAAAPAQPHPAPAYDRVLGLAVALEACAGESLFARIACEHRARTRYCDGAAHQIPQCAEPPPRDYGQ